MLEGRRCLRDQQDNFCQVSRPRPFYATLVAGTSTRRKHPLERKLPRSVSIHSPDGVINCKLLLEYLNQQGLQPKLLRLLSNNDAEITYVTIKDRDKFYRLSFVSRPAARSWEPRMRNPPQFGCASTTNQRSFSLTWFRRNSLLLGASCLIERT
eukprot:gene15896-7228_t